MSTGRVFLALIAAAALASCGGDHHKPDQKVVSPVAARDAGTGLKAQMHDHFSAIRTIERSLIVADLVEAKRHAKELAESPALAALRQHPEQVQAVREASASLIASDSLEQAAGRAARLAGECGNCHLETTSAVSFEWTDAPAAGPTDKDMRRHQWAMDRLWEGLVGPSDLSWREGVSVLRSSPFPAQALAASAEVPEAEQLISKLDQLATSARDASELSERVEVYGGLLATCSTCHKERDR